MCGRYLFTEDDEELNEIWRFTAEKYPDAPLKLGEIFPTNTAPVLLDVKGKIFPQPQIWGFPGFSGRSGVLINARAETAQEKRSFAEAVHTRRCVVPAAGFFEWRQSDKQKFLFRHTHPGALYMAGLYGDFSDERRYVILTTAPNDSVAEIHNRMPLVLEKNQVSAWLRDTNAALSLLQAVPPLLQKEAAAK